MRLLIDQNLSPKLVGQFNDLFPGSLHVQSAGLATADDDAIWNFARDNVFVIVTKDDDFSDLSVMRGSPPKVIWLQTGNCSTLQVETTFRTHFADVQAFERDLALHLLVLN